MPLNPNNLLKYGLNKEVQFLFALKQAINNDDITISKTENKYECIDFDIYNNRTKRTLFIELKSRRGDISNYNTFFIDKQKLNKISTKFTGIPVILLWIDERRNLYYTFYDDSLLNSEEGYSYGNITYLIKKDSCRYASIKELAIEITDIISKSE